MPRDLARGFTLGEWNVNPADGSVSGPGGTARLEPLLMELLLFLCARPGKVIPKNEVLDTVWRGRFVSDDTVKASFYQLRKTLGDSSREPKYIETLPKRGYRLLLTPVPLGGPADTDGDDAADLCRKAIALLGAQPSAADLAQARLYLERAVEADADSAVAAAALAQTYILLLSAGRGAGSDLLPRVLALATRAVRIAPGLSQAHAAWAIATLLYRRDVAAAEQSLRTALEIDPGNGPAHGWYAKLLSFDARHDAAEREARRAVKADPLSLALRRGLAETLLTARRYDEAIAEAQELLRMSGAAPDVHLGLSWVHYLAGNPQRAFDAVQAGFRSLALAPSLIEQVSHAFADGGIDGVYRLWADIMARQAALGQKNLDLLVLSALLGDTDRACDLVEDVLEQSHPALLWLPTSPLFDKIRPASRFAALLERARRPAA